MAEQRAAMSRLALALLVLLVCGAGARAQEVLIHIDISDQQMIVHEAGAPLYIWPVSTARAGKRTPLGVFTPKLLKRVHYSTLYDGAPMPWSIFFAGNYAIHGTTAVDNLGAPASAGCIRLAPENAETLFHMVEQAGLSDTRVVIVE
ncbi:L,D-transpeptidase [Actibacterium sp. D379-3]